MLRIGVLVSGGGTNLQAIIDGIVSGYIPDASVELVISNKKNAYALTRAAEANIETCIIGRKQFESPEAFDEALGDRLKSAKIDLVLLAGFMAILGPGFFTDFKNKVMNVHPALIPAFSGPGYYGLKVHESVLATGCKVTGASVHFVTPEVDAGPLILQQAVEVKQGDDPETLQCRVMEEAEWKIYPEAVRLFALGLLEVRGQRVYINN
ncbi:MAG: phosphoribosylglycinamide formyltransferase [Candidatus Marinimicrobia bacterium]|jgi:phosphoribosylglycinamide formyltransferase 1|nr:phosphoribosylglycinamide formyltransferase [Candidatus Neomarinimicrobiota bacterium]MBT4359627.1 phosphoribosylglycinamide formyltransferase [Candidatus Neomarinimicrobiota bacterium]MBT4713606.1 phosphoribosylglycinamide formyltransferase [Candidatus Neomarinimicrobiota bacterium]MBT4947093.1 phosphoribosylglycinamide formyltransferase [Candidatus Neomarinimicrobiota bacterium]MBT5268113.1 phosphoribosylglycinamide formyltransferase [Candidatus Neomarinimicrobiota bacterium]